MSHETKTVLAQIQHETGIVLPSPAKFGRTEIVVADSSAKSVRKVKGKIDTLVTRGVMNSDICTDDQALVHVKDGAVYLGMSLNGNTPQYVHPQIVADSSESIDKLCVVTGTCLFGEYNARAKTDTGKNVSMVNKEELAKLDTDVINQLQIAQSFHPYEMDSIARLSGMFPYVARGANPVDAYIHIPNMEYWFYLFDEYNQGKITQEALQEWCCHVNIHSKQITKAFAKRIDRVGNVNISHVDAFEPVVDVVQKGVMSGKLPRLNHLVEMLYYSDVAWQTVLEETKPQTFNDLGDAANAVPYIHGASRHDGLIAIENPEEMPILRQAKDFMPPTPLIAGLYAHPRLLVPDSSHLYGDIHDLYYLNTPMGWTEAKQIIRSNK